MESCLHIMMSRATMSPYFSVILSVFPIIPLGANLLFLNTPFLNILVALWLIGSFIG